MEGKKKFNFFSPDLVLLLIIHFLINERGDETKGRRERQEGKDSSILFLNVFYNNRATIIYKQKTQIVTNCTHGAK